MAAASTTERRSTALHVDPAAVASRGARIFMKMAFEIGMFHGDPHPGNMRVLPDGTICLLDFGMVGIIEDDKRELLVDLFLAVQRHRNLNRTVELVLRLSGSPFARSISRCCGPTFATSSRITTAFRSSS